MTNNDYLREIAEIYKNRDLVYSKIGQIAALSAIAVKALKEEPPTMRAIYVEIIVWALIDNIRKD